LMSTFIILAVLALVIFFGAGMCAGVRAAYNPEREKKKAKRARLLEAHARNQKVEAAAREEKQDACAHERTETDHFTGFVFCLDCGARSE
jgi:hypothetical protein